MENHVDCATPGISCQKPGCYDPGRYSISIGAGIVVDLMTRRRLWTRITRGPQLHSDAVSDCKALALEGVSGWRLPTYFELGDLTFMPGGLQGCPTCDPAIDQAAFISTPDSASAYYLSDEYDNQGQGWWQVWYCDGRAYKHSTANQSLYRCTRDPLP